MNLEILPVRTAGAAENMAVDFLMLKRYPRAEAARFRHYDWRGPAFTFGYSQKWQFVRAEIPAEIRDISRRRCRRPHRRLDLCARDSPGPPALGCPRLGELPCGA